MAKVKTQENKGAARGAAKAVKSSAEAVTSRAKKAVAKKVEVYLQYNDKEVNTDAVIAAAKAAFKAEMGSRTAVKSCKVYLKPQENAAYYVVNGTYTGRLDL